MFKFVLIAAIAITSAFAYSDPRDVHAETLKYQSDVKEDGSYQYLYETSNGIAAQEAGVGGYYANGGFAYVSPEGEHIQLSYKADENGFQPQGDHLPTPPPIPYQILKSLEYIRTHSEYDVPQQQYHVPVRQHQNQYRAPQKAQFGRQRHF
ncbi:pupal cuticle protein Edg-78E-like [Teleopsis dalmanni]|uniref:pupal cuticle protein Edg-78E-like n=2 Tax=Teleopsis dalmanni TaxID=139649 RepID=UPI0018CD273E|nr:pupal cuticle protein Edg-78E-like [Teleopsis dalmanni]XP_037930331.1 pupal cuticle protein Edg-78E-like [Teleopsis dalmanni]